MHAAALLRARLEYPSRFALHFDQAFAFVNRQRQRLLAVDILAGLHGGNGHERVPVVDRGADHGVDVLAFEQPSEVGVALGIGEVLLSLPPDGSRPHRTARRCCRIAWRGEHRPVPSRRTPPGPTAVVHSERRPSLLSGALAPAHSSRNQRGSVEAATALALCRKRRRDRFLGSWLIVVSPRVWWNGHRP